MTPARRGAGRGRTKPVVAETPRSPPRLLFDANVVLDVLARREPWDRDAALLLSAIEEGQATGAVAAHTITTLHYLLAKSLGRTATLTALARLTKLLDIVPVDRDVILEALALGLRDFEDAVQAVCALRIEADYLVTRDAADFRGGGVPLATPAEVLGRL